MTDPTDAILTAFYVRLNGNLSFKGTNWPVRTFGESTDEFNNVLMSEVTITDESDQDVFQTSCTILFDISQGSKNNGSWKGTNGITNKIIELCVYKEDDITIEGFRFETPVVVDSINLLKQYSDTDIIMRKLLRLRFKLEEL